MKPSEVRRRVLSDHEELRQQLERLERRAQAAVKGAADASAELRSQGEALLDRLAIHMSWEDRYLVPVVRVADGWGDERAARIAEDHREQRELLRYALRQLHDQSRPEPLVASNLLDLVALLRKDMDEEEQAFLDEWLLRDDPVAIDLFIG